MSMQTDNVGSQTPPKATRLQGLATLLGTVSWALSLKLY